MALVDMGFVTGVIPAGGQAVVAIPGQLRQPTLTATLRSSAGGRSIQFCTDGGPTEPFIPTYDTNTATQLVVVSYGPLTHVIFNGAAGDTYRVQT